MVDRTFVIADIPGIIEGASEGAGLGLRFLKHVERTEVLLHMLSVDPDPERDPVADFDALIAELGQFDPGLLERPMPVSLCVNDGLWRARRLVDFVFRVHLLDGDTRVIGPFMPPAAVDELEAFVASLGDRIAEELDRMRSTS